MKNLWTSLVTSEYWKNLLEDIGASGAGLVAILIFYLVARSLIGYAVRQFSGPLARLDLDPIRARRLETLGSLVQSFLRISLTLVTLIMALQTIGVKVVPLITAAGIAGLAIGFGAQKLVRDVINGFFILLENQFSVGEKVTIGAVTGTVIDAGLRITRIQDDQGRLYILANGDINSVCNHSRSDLGTTLEVSISPSADIDKACRVLDSAGADVSKRFRLPAPFKCQGISNFDASRVTLKLVGLAPPDRQDAVLNALRQQVLDSLRDNEIPIV